MTEPTETKRAWVTIVALVVFALSGPVGLPLSVLIGAALAICTLAVLIGIAPAGKLVLPRSLIVVVVWLVVSQFWAIDLDSRVVLTSVELVAVTAIAVILGSRNHLATLTTGIAVGIVACSLVSVAFAVLTPDFGRVSVSHEQGALQGIYSHRNLLAFTMACGLPACWFGFGRRRSRFFATGTVLASLLLAQSVTALAAVVCGVVAVVGFRLVSRVSRLHRPFVVIEVLVLAALIIFWMYQNVDSVVEGTGRDLTFTGRSAIWQAALDFVRDRPLTGWGWGAVWEPGSMSASIYEQLSVLPSIMPTMHS